MSRRIKNEQFREQTGDAAKIEAVRRIAADYQADPGRGDPEIERVDDLYDETTGLPR